MLFQIATAIKKLWRNKNLRGVDSHSIRNVYLIQRKAGVKVCAAAVWTSFQRAVNDEYLTSQL